VLPPTRKSEETMRKLPGGGDVPGGAVGANRELLSDRLLCTATEEKPSKLLPAKKKGKGRKKRRVQEIELPHPSEER